MAKIIPFPNKRKKKPIQVDVEQVSFQETATLEALRRGWGIHSDGEDVRITVLNKSDALDAFIASIQFNGNGGIN